MHARVELVVGAGGVGRSTVAAAICASASAAGDRVLLMCLDGHPPTAAEQLPGVDVVVVDAVHLLRERYRSASTLARAAGMHQHAASVSMPDPDEITGLPGAEELVALSRVREAVVAGAHDVVVVDCPSGRAWTRMAGTPAQLRAYLESMWPEHARVTAALGSDIRAATLAALVDRLDATAARVEEMFSDGLTVGATIVAAADERSLTAARELLAANALTGIRTDRVVVNRVLPDFGSAPTSVLGVHPAVYWYAAVGAGERAVLDAFVAEVDPMRVVAVMDEVGEPVGSATLDRIGLAMQNPQSAWGTDSFPATVPQVRLESGSGLDSVYVMTVQLPFVDANEVGVGRVEDDVIISAGHVHRRFRLASVLRRCEVVGAVFDGDTLIIRFTPDPAVWPL